MRIMVDDGAAGSPEAELTPEQRVDAAIADARFGRAGLGSLGIGERMGTGGGGVGQFVFADLAELKSVTDHWKADRDRFQQADELFQRAIKLCNPPAGDIMSRFQANAMKKSLTEARNHNQALYNYANDYVLKLEVAWAAMAGTEQDNAGRLRTAGED